MYLVACSCGTTAMHETEGVAELLARTHLFWCREDDAVVNVYEPGEWDHP